MKLGIISDCIHYKDAGGFVGTENHIFLRQIEQLASHFTHTFIACPFGKFDESKTVSNYNGDFTFIPLPVVGGQSLKSKFHFFTAFPKWFRSFHEIDKNSDIVYQRFPNNLNIPGLFYFLFKKKKVFATYTGTWKDRQPESITYEFQKWLLRNFFRGPVWVYTNFANADKRIKAGFSPSYSYAEWDEETEQVKKRIASIEAGNLQKFRLITVGTLIGYKNQLTILKACEILKARNFSFSLRIVGGGPMEELLSDYILKSCLSNEVQMVGKKNYQELRELYRQSDFVVQAPLKEGFGKVPIEGFFHGVVPVLNDLNMAGYMTGNEERGFLFDAENAQNLANKFFEIKDKKSQLPVMIENGRAFAKSQTLEKWANDYYATISEYYKKQ